MAISGTGLQFHPLYWVFHDQWQYYIDCGNGNYIIYDHWGHTHFFMLGFNWESNSGDAFSGQQVFSFELQDIWGPSSDDPNQSQLYRVIGTPKWYFRVRELWRRVFIQPWDSAVNATEGILRQRGIKYDASESHKTMGPFREGRDGLKSYCPMWMANARSLPIEYYQTSGLVQQYRDNYVAECACALLKDDYEDAVYNLQHGHFIPHGTPPAKPPFSDELYIWPIIEYQQALQLDWEPLPGSTPDVDDLNDANEDYGDGWAVQVPIPFVDPSTRKYRSPFADEPGVVLPLGKYNEALIGPMSGRRKLVPDAQRLRHATVQYDDQHPYRPPLDLPPAKSGTIITDWHNPWAGADEGRIVQQCLGGVVEARARIILEHKLGGRREAWTDAIQYMPQTVFEGSDQNSPAGP